MEEEVPSQPRMETVKGWHPLEVPVSAASKQLPSVIPHFAKSAPVASGSGRGPAAERGSRGRPFMLNTGVLQPPFLTAKANRRIPAHNRPIETERYYSVPVIQDGDSAVHSNRSAERGMDFSNRYQGRLPPYSSETQLQEIPQVCSERSGVPVLFTPVWPVGGPENFYFRTQACDSGTEVPGRENTRLFRRLVREDIAETRRQGTRFSDNRAIANAGLADKLGQISHRRYSAAFVPGNRFQPGYSHCTSRPEGLGEYQMLHKEPSPRPEDYSQEIGISSGPSDTLGPVCAERETALTQAPTLGFSEMETGPRTLESVDHHRLLFPDNLKLVHKEEEFPRRNAITPPNAIAGNVYGCLHNGLGGNSGVPPGQRGLETTGETPAYKSVGDEGGNLRLSPISTQTSQQCDKDPHRQQLCGGLSTKRGGNTVLEANPIDTARTGLVRHKQSRLIACPYRRASEHSCRLSLEVGSGTVRGMVINTGGVQSDLSEVLSAPGRPDGHLHEQENSRVCVPSSRSASNGGGCFQYGLAKQQSICIPSSSASDQIYSSAAVEVPQPHHSGGVNVSNQTLLSRSAGNGIGTTSTSSQTTGFFVAENPGGGGDTITPSSSPVPPGGMAPAGLIANLDRLSCISEILRHKGVPEDVIDLAKRPQRVSTSAVYNKHWEYFVTYCRRIKIDPFKVTEAELASYLLSLHVRGLLPATVKVHKSSILSVLKHILPALSNSVLIADLLRRLELERPRTVKVLPKFDIELVLHQFLKPPFVDNNNSDRGTPLSVFVTKTAFLLALATGSRSSEMHAFIRSTDCFKNSEDGSGSRSLILKTFPGFLVKNQRPDELPVQVTIPSMDHLVGPKDLERLWCPVRAASIYMARTPNGAYSAEDIRLLRHPDPAKKTTKGNVAAWIRQAISTAYERAGDSRDYMHVNAHEVRAVAHSLALYNGATLSEVLQGGNWRSDGSLFKHYLRNMSSATGSKTVCVAAGKLLRH